eukprot:TRINITY_DN2867_c0_g1_i6.p1 TRINITY_DN2867_c0_g1~~TRINITY_DN2867_c0_g1_i6.p1  ORF type:complete len:295 (+),score=10.90 TRINITY_DN2867_c0_g1_i6:172-1056(+)
MLLQLMSLWQRVGTKQERDIPPQKKSDLQLDYIFQLLRIFLQMHILINLFFYPKNQKISYNCFINWILRHQIIYSYQIINLVTQRFSQLRICEQITNANNNQCQFTRCFFFPGLHFCILLLGLACASEIPLIDYYDLEQMDLLSLEKEYNKSLIEDEACFFDPLDHMITWNTLMIHNELINRTVTLQKGGMSSVTESEDPRLAFKIKKHVHQMFARMQCRHPVRSWDPLFQAIFQAAPAIVEQIGDTQKGIKYKRTSTDDYAEKVILAHAAVIDEFVAKGRDQTRKGHPAPEKK